MPERAFLDWTEPTAVAVAHWFRRHAPDRPLFLVPTQSAGRRLRAALKTPATILTPAQFLAPENAPHAAQTTLRLAAELAAPRSARLSALFPAGVPARDFRERLGLARRLLALRRELAENHLTPAQAAARFPAGSGEAARWSDLARLLDRVTDNDAEAQRLARAADPRLPEGCASVVVAAVPDLQPLVIAALTRLDAPTTVLIPAAGEELESFDAWGRPRPESWFDRDPGWKNFPTQVHLVSRPDQLEFPARIPLEIGLLDRDLLPALRDALGEHPLHDPIGEPLTRHWVVRTLAALISAAADPSLDRVAELLRNGAVRAWLSGIDAEAALAEVDQLRARHFPATARAAQPWRSKFPAFSAALGALETTFDRLRNDPATTVRELLPTLAPELDDPVHAALDTALTAELPRLPLGDWLQAFTETLADERLYPERPPHAVEASGWLELPWSEAPTLVLAGVNLGRLPVPLGGELLLTDAARSTLELATTENRRARDTYLLARILAQTRPGGVHGLVSQLDAEGAPLHPSPLLFAGAGDALPARVDYLFGDPRPPRPDPAWTAGWTFDPPVIELPRRVAVTDFARYLDCPFTFYLGRAAKMAPFAPAADELDAAQFGDLMHIALEGWARDERASRSTEPDEIRAVLDAHLDRWVKRELGRSLSLPLRVQIDSARRRLHAFAEWQARDAHEGWRVQSVEVPFAEILGRDWELDGWVVSGKVDRLDRHERDGRWRVIDYKTFDAPDSPEKKHLRTFRAADRTWPPDYARVPESASWWINLQLPLYLALLHESGRDSGQTHTGYFNLPKTIADTGLQTWDDLDAPRLASALTCARGVLADLGRRRFWPPNPRAEHAEFAEFFPPEPGRIVDPAGAFLRSCAP